MAEAITKMLLQFPRSGGRIDWSVYDDHGPGVNLPLRDLAPIQALVAVDRLLSDKPWRIAALRDLLRAQGLQLTNSDESIGRLSCWFVRNVEAARRESRRLEPAWYSVANDITLYLGETLIGRTKVLRWIFDSGSDGPIVPSHLAARVFVRPGLKIALPSGVETEHCLHLDDLVVDYAHAVVAGHHVDPEHFLNVLLAGVLAV